MSWRNTLTSQGAPGGLLAARLLHHLLQGPENLSSSDIVQVSSAAFFFFLCSMLPFSLDFSRASTQTHTQTYTHTHPPTRSLTGLLVLGFAGALAGLAPNRQSVLQQLQAPALLPAGRSDLHHAAALHHQPNVVAVRTCGKTETYTQRQITPLCSSRKQNNRLRGPAE